MKNKDKWIYKKEEILLANDSLLLEETIFHNANGYLGVRANFEEGYPAEYDTIRGTYINGFYDIAEMKQAEKLYGLPEEKQTMLNVADFQTIKIRIDNEEFSMFEGSVLKSRRFVNMQKGYTGRIVHWRSPDGKEIELLIRRMASFWILSLFTIEYKVKAVNFDGLIEIYSYHNGDVMNYSNPDDPRVAGESVKYLIPEKIWFEDEVSYCESVTSKSELKMISAVTHKVEKELKKRFAIKNKCACVSIRGRISKDETIKLVKYAIITDSLRTDNVKEQAKQYIEQVKDLDIAEIYQKQSVYLSHFWKQAELKIDGDDELELAVRYNIYQLIQSVGKDEHSNIAAKGLSGEGYEGHYFWDTEMYIQPFFVLTVPEITKNLISYRYTTLESARENARLMGHKKGALYPWRTISGSECSGFFPAGTAQYHINSDVASSIVAYYLATGDKEFMIEKGAEIVIETARLWADMGSFHNGKYELHCVTGPDEYTCVVNNNYYTNVSAKYNLNWAVKLYTMLKEEGRLLELEKKIHITEEEISYFTLAAANMYLPYDSALDINPQDDSFLHKNKWDISATPKEKFPLLLHYHPLHLYRFQVCKQADTVMAHFLYEDEQSEQTMKHSLEYYEKITTHDSSLSTCIFSIMASRLGMTEKAYDYFGDSAKLDLFNTHKNTKDGIHTANMGGNYMAIIYGFGRVRIKEQGLFLAPILPKDWNTYEFYLMYHSSRISVTVNKTGCEIELLEGMEQEVFIYGEKFRLIKEEKQIFVR